MGLFAPTPQPEDWAVLALALGLEGLFGSERVTFGVDEVDRKLHLVGFESGRIAAIPGRDRAGRDGAPNLWSYARADRAMASILIIDDDPTIRAMFARALKDLGHVEQASNGAEALRLLGAQKYNVVLLDLHMPIIDGFVILHTLASKPGPNKETPVYVVTADGSDQARIRALRRHAVFFLTKPVPITTLVNLVDSTLKKSAARAATPTKPPSTVPSSLSLSSGRSSATPPPPASDHRGEQKSEQRSEHSRTGEWGIVPRVSPSTSPPLSPKKS